MREEKICACAAMWGRGVGRRRNRKWEEKKNLPNANESIYLLIPDTVDDEYFCTMSRIMNLSATCSLRTPNRLVIENMMEKNGL